MLPGELGGTRVKVGGHAAPLFYVSPGQVNAQIPFVGHGDLGLELSCDNGTAVSRARVARTAPSILAVTTVDGRRVTTENPGEPGKPVVVYATGLGPCRQVLGFGEAPSTPAVADVDVSVSVGSIVVKPAYAGVAPGFVGLDQVNFWVPDTLASGTYPLRITTPDGSSRAFPLIVRLSEKN